MPKYPFLKSPKSFCKLPNKKNICSLLHLKNWTLLSEYGKQGDTTKIWECPSLFKVPVEGSAVEKWVLLISSGHKTEGFVGMQYFVGDFDGVQFSAQKQN